jgi:integrase/recombinase XerD
VFREVPVPAELFGVIHKVHGLEDRSAQLWRLSRCRCWQLVKGIMHEAGIVPGPHATPRGLRHSFGLHAIRSGVPLNLVQRWLGHASMHTTAIYLQAIGDEEREIAARMWNDQRHSKAKASVRDP